MVTSWFLTKLSSKIYIHDVVNIIKTLMGDIFFSCRNFFEANPASRSCSYAEFNAVFRLFIRSLEVWKFTCVLLQALRWKQLYKNININNIYIHVNYIILYINIIVAALDLLVCFTVKSNKKYHLSNIPRSLLTNSCYPFPTVPVILPSYFFWQLFYIFEEWPNNGMAMNSSKFKDSALLVRYI